MENQIVNDRLTWIILSIFRVCENISTLCPFGTKSACKQGIDIKCELSCKSKVCILFDECLTNKDNINDNLHEISWLSTMSNLSATSAMCIANFSATRWSSRFTTESIPSKTSSAARFVNRSGWSHIFFKICLQEKNQSFNKTGFAIYSSSAETIITFSKYRLSKWFKFLSTFTRLIA